MRQFSGVGQYPVAMNTNITLAQRTRFLTSSAIREILKITERGEVISFAGGLPSPTTFPVERIREATLKVLADNPQTALQYGPTEGFAPLREWIAARLARRGAAIEPSRVLVTTGSQQGLDLLGKCLIDEGSKVLVETPSYLGAMQSFALFQPDYAPMPADGQGIDTDALTPQLLQDGRLMYCVPDFQNPTGLRLPLQRRKTLVEKAAAANVPVVEDDPYGELSYSGETLPSLLSLNPQGGIYMGSFSKVLSPGMRLGYIVAPQPLFAKLVQAKQAADLHTPLFTQRIVHEMVKDGFLYVHIPTIRDLYSRQCRCMLNAMAQHFPKQAQWTKPDGGMFIWVTLPHGIDTGKLLDKAAARNVVFVPGKSFFARNAQLNTLRLSFVTVPQEKIEAGIETLGALLREEIDALLHEEPVCLKAGGKTCTFKC
jgi:2-aminoadipate transaminase